MASVIIVVAATVDPEPTTLLLPELGTNEPAAAEDGSEDGVSARILLACCWLVAVISWFRAEWFPAELLPFTELLALFV